MPDDRFVPAWLDRAAALSWRLLVVGALVWGALAALFDLFLVIVPVFAAIVLSALFAPAAAWLRRRGLGAGTAAGIAVTTGLLLAVTVLALVVWRFASMGPELVADAGDLRARAVDWLAAAPFGVTEQDAVRMIEQAVGSLQDNAGRIVSGALGGTRILLELVSGALLALVLSFFFVRDGGGMVRWTVDRLVPDGRRGDLLAAAEAAYGTLTHYVHGVVAIGHVNAAGVGLGLLVLDVPLILPLTVLVFLGAFFPVIGAFVSGLAAVLVAVITRGLVTGLLVLGVIVLVQQLEGHLLQPLVMGRQVPLHPAVVLVVLTAGGVLAGIAGAAMAVPVAAGLSAAGHVLRSRRDDEVEDGPARPDGPR